MAIKVKDPGTARPAPEPSERASLETLLETLGSRTVKLIVAPRGLDVPIGEPMIYDLLETTPIEQDAIVLPVGIQPGSQQATRLIRDAGRAGAAAVVFKDAETSASFVQEADAENVALLSVPGEMTWTQLHALLTSAARFGSRSGSVAGVPMGDLFALANAIAGMVGGATTIEDPHRRVLAYSTLDDQPIDRARRTAILGRQVPDFPGIRELYQRVWAADGVLRADRAMLRSLLGPGAEFADLQARTAVAVRAAGEILGSIWVSHGSKPLAAEAERALTEAGRIAVPHVIQARATRDVERRMRADMLCALLEGRGASEATAVRLGMSASAPLIVLAFRAVDGEPVEELRRERLVDLVAVYCEAFRRHAATVAIGDTVYTLLPVEKNLTLGRVLQVATEIAEHARKRLRTPLHAACGSIVSGVRDIPRTRREADRVLQVLATDPEGRAAASVEDVRSHVTLLEIADLASEHPELQRGVYGAVLAYDLEHNTEYGRTLRAYLDAFGDVPMAARTVSIHPNTFRYRLRRMLDIFGLDLDDPDERLVLSLQSRFVSLSQS